MLETNPLDAKPTTSFEPICWCRTWNNHYARGDHHN